MSPTATLLGIRLLVRLGTTLLPPPAELLRAITQVQVTNDGAGQDGFSITFTLTRQALDFNLLTPGLLEPPTRVLIGVLLGAVPEVLIDGVITHLQLSPSEDPGASTLTVMGRDWSEAMNFHEQNRQYPNQSDDVIFRQVVAGYSRFGALPDALPAVRSPQLEVQEIPNQTTTDLGFVRELADRNGYVFYVEPITIGVNRAYFGPATRAGVPQPALTGSMGSSSNVTQLSFADDALAASSPAGHILEPTSKVAIPIPPVPSPRLPLAAQPTVLRTTILREVANLPLDQAIAAAMRDLQRAPEAVRGTGQLDTVRYGAVLRARRPVGVRGAGLRHDGLYYVEQVTHSITRSDYSQRFTITREGSGSTVPAVLP